MTPLPNKRGAVRPEYANPVEQVAEEIAAEFGFDFSAFEDRPRSKHLRMASAAIRRLRQLNFINDIGLASIKAEEQEEAKK